VVIPIVCPGRLVKVVRHFARSAHQGGIATTRVQRRRSTTARRGRTARVVSVLAARVLLERMGSRPPRSRTRTVRNVLPECTARRLRRAIRVRACCARWIRAVPTRAPSRRRRARAVAELSVTSDRRLVDSRHRHRTHRHHLHHHHRHRHRRRRRRSTRRSTYLRFLCGYKETSKIGQRATRPRLKLV